MIPPLITVMPVRSDVNWAAMVERARIAAGLSQKELAALMGMSPAQLSQQTGGLRHLSLQRVDRTTLDPQGQVFFTHLLTEWAAARGVSDLSLVREWLRSAVQSFAQLKRRVAHAQIRRTA